MIRSAPAECGANELGALGDAHGPGHGLGWGWRWRDHPEQPLEAGRQQPRIHRRGRRRNGTCPTRRQGRGRFAPEQPETLEGPRLEGQAGVAVRPVEDEPGPQRGLGVGASSTLATDGSDAARQHRPALDQDELAGDRDERADVRIRSVRGRPARRDRRRPGRPSGTVITSSWRGSMSVSRSASGPSKRRAGPACSTRAGSRSPSVTDGATGDLTLRSSVGLVGEAERLARRRLARVGLVADQLRGPRRAARGQRHPADRSAWSRSRSSAGPNPGTPRATVDRPRTPRARRATRRRAGRRRRSDPWRQSWKSPASRRSGSSRRPPGARPPRPGRDAGRRRASRRTGRAARASASRPAPPARRV